MNATGGVESSDRQSVFLSCASSVQFLLIVSLLLYLSVDARVIAADPAQAPHNKTQTSDTLKVVHTYSCFLSLCRRSHRSVGSVAHRPPPLTSLRTRHVTHPSPYTISHANELHNELVNTPETHSGPSVLLVSPNFFFLYHTHVLCTTSLTLAHLIQYFLLYNSHKAVYVFFFFFS